MNSISNVPVQMINVVDTTGDITPLKFRIEGDDRSLITVNILKTLSRQDCNFVGQQYVKYVCSAEIEGRQVIFEMKYLVLTHKWVLSRFLS